MTPNGQHLRAPSRTANNLLTAAKATALSIILRLPFVLFLGVFVVIVWAQSGVAPAQQRTPDQGSPFMDLVPGSRSVWFFIFVGWYVFSAITSGMPEPTKESSPWYIWAYRSFHILSASGTSFFQNKLYWPERTATAQGGKEADQAG